MICPHCHIGTSPAWTRSDLGFEEMDGERYAVVVQTANCTECERLFAEAFRVHVDSARLSMIGAGCHR